MKVKFVFLLLGVILVGLALASCGPPPTPAPTPTPTAHPGAALVTSRCSSCHSISRVTTAAYDQEGWQFTVDRMVISGAQLSAEQVPMVVEYLAATYPKK